MTYQLKSPTFYGHTIQQCVAVADGGSEITDVVNITTSGETPLDNYGTASGKTVTPGRTWNGVTLPTFRTYRDVQLIHGWEVNSADRIPLTGSWHSIFIAAYRLELPISNPGSGNIWGDRGVGKGLGLNTAGNLVWVAGSSVQAASSAVVTTVDKCSIGMPYAAGSPNSAFWYVEGDGTTAIDTFDSTFNSGWSVVPTFATHVNGQAGNSVFEAFFIATFDGQVTGPQYQELHNDGLGALVDLPGPGGSAAPALRANPRIILP